MINYGIDPVEFVRDWVAIVKDVYLTLRFSTVWGNLKKHYVNLLASGSFDNPCEVEFSHNASSDVNGKVIDALVAFQLDKLPDTRGGKIKLKII